MLSNIPASIPSHVACYSLTTCTNKEISRQAFLDYFLSFTSLTKFESSIVSISGRQFGPDWFQLPFTSVSEPSILAMGQKLLRPYHVVYYLPSHEVKVFLVHPQFFSWQ